jgi:hypothetical protein
MKRLVKIGVLAAVATVVLAGVVALTRPAYAMWMCPIGGGAPASCPVLVLGGGTVCYPVGCNEGADGGCEYLCTLR